MMTVIDLINGLTNAEKRMNSIDELQIRDLEQPIIANKMKICRSKITKIVAAK